MKRSRGSYDSLGIAVPYFADKSKKGRFHPMEATTAQRWNIGIALMFL